MLSVRILDYSKDFLPSVPIPYERLRIHLEGLSVSIRIAGSRNLILTNVLCLLKFRTSEATFIISTHINITPDQAPDFESDP